jgi:hypothetical protein
MVPSQEEIHWATLPVLGNHAGRQEFTMDTLFERFEHEGSILGRRDRESQENHQIAAIAPHATLGLHRLRGTADRTIQ